MRATRGFMQFEAWTSDRGKDARLPGFTPITVGGSCRTSWLSTDKNRYKTTQKTFKCGLVQIRRKQNRFYVIKSTIKL